MIELVQGAASDEVIVTLNEKATLATPYYLFVFTHATTKEVVSFVRSYETDLSDTPTRYNRFDINTGLYFLNKPSGEWLYEVYEQGSNTNTDPDLATGLLENGKMNLRDSEEFTYTEYNQAVTYKAYDGD